MCSQFSRFALVCHYREDFISNCKLVISKLIEYGCPNNILRKYILKFGYTNSKTLAKYRLNVNLTDLLLNQNFFLFSCVHLYCAIAFLFGFISFTYFYTSISYFTFVLLIFILFLCLSPTGCATILYDEILLNHWRRILEDVFLQWFRLYFKIYILFLYILLYVYDNYFTTLIVVVIIIILATMQFYVHYFHITTIRKDFRAMHTRNVLIHNVSFLSLYLLFGCISVKLALSTHWQKLKVEAS